MLILEVEWFYIQETIQINGLEKIHTGHFGITKTQQRVHQAVYRPKTNADIEKMCESRLIFTNTNLGNNRNLS